MQLIETGFKGLFLLQPKVFKDPRGYFYESYNLHQFEKMGLKLNFIQDNQSLSGKGILRGMHFQNPPHAQGKLVRVVKGAVQDVVVDIRKGSETYGKHFSVILNEENFTMMYIPEGFAHGFATLEENTIFSYKCTDVYHPETEGGLMWNDEAFNINWEIKDPILSEKDKIYQKFANFESNF
jgi:dTDP-4-dehydrorhamnose 3,5-epimerase